MLGGESNPERGGSACAACGTRDVCVRCAGRVGGASEMDEKRFGAARQALSPGRHGAMMPHEVRATRVNGDYLEVPGPGRLRLNSLRSRSFVRETESSARTLAVMRTLKLRVNDGSRETTGTPALK